MKILAFSFATGMIGGSNRSFLTVLSGLKQWYNHEIDVVLPNDNGELCRALDEAGIHWIKLPFFPVSAVDIDSPNKSIKLIKYSLTAMLDKFVSLLAAQKLKNRKYDVIYINDNPAYFGAMVARKIGVPYVWHFRSPRSITSRHVAGSKVLFENASTIIAISNSMKAQYQKLPELTNTNMSVVLNAIPLEDVNKANVLEDKEFNIVQCGRICKAKGQLESIRAIEELVNAYNIRTVKLHLAGDVVSGNGAEYRKMLIQYIHEHGISNHVIFEGNVKDMGALRERMQCEVVCSENEPFGRVVVEAMRSGLVIIGANCGGIPEIITDNATGLLYETGNSSDLVRKLILIIGNPDLRIRLAENAYKYANEHFLPEELVYKVDRILKHAYESR